MVRKLALVLAWLGPGLVPGWAYALGLGEFELNSYLNQPVDAEIALVGSGGENLDALRVSLASTADFARAGLDYNDSLRKLRFSVAHGPDGKPYIKVWSEQPYREPYLNILVEVNWPKGRLLRQYTALVDPPVTVPTERAAAPRPAVSTQTEPAPAAGEDERFPRIPIGEERGPTQVAAAPAPSASRQRSAETYGPTERNDTLWQIAKKVRPDSSVTIEQTMLALLEANPEAFIGNNINRLKAGYVLQIPDRAAMSRLSARQARAESQRQYRAWKAAKAQPAPTSTARQADAGSSGAQPERAAAQPEQAQSGAGRLQLLPPQGEGQAAETAGGSGAAGSEGTVRRKLALAQEAAEAQRQENVQLRERLNQLEEQVQDLEKLAALKDDQLAALQNRLAELRERAGAARTGPLWARESAGEPAAGSPSESASEPVVVNGDDTPIAVEEAAPAEATGTGETTPDEAGAAEAQVAQAPSTSSASANPYAVSGYRPVEPASLADSAPAARAGGAGEAGGGQSAPTGIAGVLAMARGYADQAWGYARTNPTIAGGAGAGVLLLLLLGAMMRQRRRAAAGVFEESILDEPEPQVEGPSTAAAQEAVAAEAVTPAEDKKAGGDSSYISDFAISSMDSIQSEVSEADPLTEADVFLAYGRFQPAEAMIKEAIENEPGRLDYKLKLLEIYHAAKNREAFEREAQALRESLDSETDPTWAKVVQMGRDLIPDSALFSEAASAAEAPAAEEEEEPAGLAQFEVPEMPGEESLDEPAASAGPAEAGLEFNPGEALGEEPGAAAESEDTEVIDRASGGEGDDNVIDFDLGDFEGVGMESPAQESATAQESAAGESGDEDLGLDFALDMSPESAEHQPESTDDTEQLASNLADELSELAESLHTEPAGAGAAEGDDTASYDLPMDSAQSPVQEAAGGETAELAGEDADDTEVIEGGFGAEVDEVGTKLDLAKAYIDMGDPEGARSILDEVLEEGNDDQKTEAQELLQQIA